MSHEFPPVTFEIVNDPEQCAAMNAQNERFEKNWAWLEAHATEAYSHRGKYICVAGQQLFVGNSVAEILTQAKTAHPEDNGRLTMYVPKERMARIYAH